MEQIYSQIFNILLKHIYKLTNQNINKNINEKRPIKKSNFNSFYDYKINRFGSLIITVFSRNLKMIDIIADFC